MHLAVTGSTRRGVGTARQDSRWRRLRDSAWSARVDESEQPKIRRQNGNRNMARTGETDETDRLISSEKVDGATVYNRNGENIGSIDHLMID